MSAPRPGLLDELRHSRSWISFSPPRPFDPTTGRFPADDDLRRWLAQLAGEGWRGLVTYSTAGALSAVPRLARECGFERVVAGIAWADAAQLARERAGALAALRWIDGLVVGNEGLRDGCYGRGELLDEMAGLRAATGLPVTTSETLDVYLADPEPSALGDWLFPNLHTWFDPALREPAIAAATVERQYRALQARAPGRLVVVKESWWPTAGDPAATEAGQVAFFAALAASAVPFVFGEAYDMHWKREPLGQGPHWGLHDADGVPKLAIPALRGSYRRPAALSR